uniref:Uncharacterized protein n=1 Tax=Amphimedon queenslandica TaxID=400682 RepID=A0A1X7TXU9_AMPQE
MIKAICVLLLLLCACQAFGEGPANDNGKCYTYFSILFLFFNFAIKGFEQDLENGFDGMNNGQEADTNVDERFNGDAQEHDELDSDEIGTI